MEAKARSWTRWIALAVGAMAFLAISGIATARLGTKSDSAPIAPQENGTATASCGRGAEAVAGGFAAPGLDPSAETGPAILTFESRRPGHGKWRASGHNFHMPAPAAKGTAGTGPLVAYAYCDKRDPSLTVRSKSATVAAGGHATLTPKCGRESEAVSGGFADDAPGSEGLTAFAYTSRRAGERGWKIGVQNPDSASHKATAFAYCEKHGPDLVTRSSSVDFKPTGTRTTTAKCPQGAKIFSGGYKSTFAQSSNEVNYGLAYTSKRVKGDKWKVSAIRVLLNSVGSVTTETAFAYCAT